MVAPDAGVVATNTVFPGLLGPGDWMTERIWKPMATRIKATAKMNRPFFICPIDTAAAGFV